MNQALSAVLLVVGIVLIVMGFRASEALGSEISRFFTGEPTDRTLWLLVGGIVVFVLGAFGLMRRGR